MLIVFGCSLAVAFGQHESEVYSLHRLLNLYTHLRFFIYGGIVTFFILGEGGGVRELGRGGRASVRAVWVWPS